MVYLTKLPTIKYNSSQYSLDINLSEAYLSIIMQLHSLPLSTRKLSKTIRILEKNLPSIFQNQCFNEENLSFYNEAKNTEIGHLFEHILLENIVLLNDPQPNITSLQGKTSWNWEKDPLGKFYIQVTPITLKRSQLVQCLKKSIGLTNTIIDSGSRNGLLN